MNLSNVFVGIFIFTIIFLPDKYLKNKIRNKDIRELIDIFKFICVTSIILYALLFVIDLASSQKIFGDGSHIVKSIQVINIFIFMSTILVKKIFKLFYKSSNEKGFLFIIPAVNALITVIYYFNQKSDFFLKFRLLKDIFKLFKHSDTNTVTTLSKIVTGVLLLENGLILTYILIIVNNSNNVNIMKHICETVDNKVSLNKRCANEILQDLFFYSLFFKLVVAIIVILGIFYINKNKAAQESTTTLTNTAVGVVNAVV